MKTKLKISFLAVCAVIAMCVFVSKQKKDVADSLTLMNIEALASGESSNARCYGTGSVDCPFDHLKVYFVE